MAKKEKTKPSEVEPMALPEPGITLRYMDEQGKEVEAVISEEDFERQIRRVEVVEAVVAAEETRSRRQYESAKKFVSLKLSFADVCALVKLATPESLVRARHIGMLYVREQIMTAEAMVHEMLCHQTLKDNLAVYRRDPSNPYVMVPHDLRKADEAASTVRAPLQARVVGVTVNETETRR